MNARDSPAGVKSARRAGRSVPGSAMPPTQTQRRRRERGILVAARPYLASARSPARQQPTPSRRISGRRLGGSVRRAARDSAPPGGLRAGRGLRADLSWDRPRGELPRCRYFSAAPSVGKARCQPCDSTGGEHLFGPCDIPRRGRGRSARRRASRGPGPASSWSSTVTPSRSANSLSAGDQSSSPVSSWAARRISSSSCPLGAPLTSHCLSRKCRSTSPVHRRPRRETLASTYGGALLPEGKRIGTEDISWYF